MEGEPMTPNMGDSVMLSFSDYKANPDDYLPPPPVSTAEITKSVAIPGNHHSERYVTNGSQGDLESGVTAIVDYIRSRGFVFEPWQIAAFVTAVRAKPFVLLAGISGTGKSKLPRLVAAATSSEFKLVPVRPNWSDSSDLLGYERLNGQFQPGPLLEMARQAQLQPAKQFLFLLDEMNLARVEYYLAEVLSHIESIDKLPDGTVASAPLIPHAGIRDGVNWGDVRLPENLCIVGSINMDETTFGFSRKVLDRAFVIEFSSVDLSEFGITAEIENAGKWSRSDWHSLAFRLTPAELANQPLVPQIVEVLTEINKILSEGQLQFGYRVRDEIIRFCIAAQGYRDLFSTSEAEIIDPLDLAIAMKVLPRIQGGGVSIKRILDKLDRWASPSKLALESNSVANESIRFPYCSERITLMLQRLTDDGFTNYWL